VGADRRGYRFDARTFEAAIRPDTELFVLSHPHSPTGNVWTEDELRAMGEICARYGVLVISDEIHQDLSHSMTSAIEVVSPNSAYHCRTRPGLPRGGGVFTVRWISGGAALPSRGG
jgi:bifunctional pyridoxal-dependent enzyme with beta-cystathionase and maltose regulon repressor activities